jgi:hypothetical protein
MTPPSVQPETNRGASTIVMSLDGDALNAPRPVLRRAPGLHQSSDFWFRPEAVTLAPTSWKSLAVARPMPLLQLLPSSVFTISSLVSSL